MERDIKYKTSTEFILTRLCGFGLIATCFNDTHREKLALY